MLVTPAGLTGLAVILDVSTASVLAAMAAAVCLSGAVCWIASLAFRLTVVPWAAERVVTVGDVPDGYVAYDRWAGALYCAHLLTAYLASAVLGVPCSSRTSCRRGSAGPASGGGSPALTRLTCAAEAVTG